VIEVKLSPELIRQQLELLRRECPELSDEDDQLRADMISGETDMDAFLHRIELKRREALQDMRAIADDIRTMTQRADRFERQEQAVRKVIHQLLDAAGLKRYKIPLATYSIGSSQKVIVIDDSAIPDDFVRIKREPDKTKIGAHLKTNQDVPGCTLSNAEPYLRISTT
jgi:hypothetical protein